MTVQLVGVELLPGDVGQLVMFTPGHMTTSYRLGNGCCI